MASSYGNETDTYIATYICTHTPTYIYVPMDMYVNVEEIC